MDDKRKKQIPLKSIPSAHRSEERELRQAERDFRKAKQMLHDKRIENRKLSQLQQTVSIKLPNFLKSVTKRSWASVIASGIIKGFLDRCSCDIGCELCFYIGWKRVKSGTIIDIEPPFYSTSEYGHLKGLSYKTICRRCDEGLITAFRLPSSQHVQHRYILDTELTIESIG